MIDTIVIFDCFIVIYQFTSLVGQIHFLWMSMCYLLNHAAIELFWMDKAFIMLEDDYEGCEKIYSMYRGHKKSPIESLCKTI